MTREYIREAYMQPRAVRKALEGLFGAEVILEVFYAVDDYSMYWDINRTGEGFDIAHLSNEAKIAFRMIYEAITKYNENYIHRQMVNKENALVGADKRRQQEEKNKKRREDYKKQKEEPQRHKSEDFEQGCGQVGATCQKREDIILDEAQKDGCFRFAKKQTKTILSPKVEKTLSESRRSLIGLLVTDNSSKEELSVVTEERECEGKHFIHKKTGDKIFPDARNNPTSGLSGNNLRDTADKTLEGKGSKAVRGSKAIKGNKAVRQSKAHKRQRQDDKRAVSSKFSGKDGFCSRFSHYDLEIVIDERFEIDFFDPAFEPYNVADDFLKKGVEKWMMAHKLGRSIEKKWIAKQIWKFACNQGKSEIFIKHWENMRGQDD